ncbi:MAG: hypothetical protein AAF799_46875 [Myxococcota bacterium]
MTDSSLTEFPSYEDQIQKIRSGDVSFDGWDMENPAEFARKCIDGSEYRDQYEEFHRDYAGFLQQFIYARSGGMRHYVADVQSHRRSFFNKKYDEKAVRLHRRFCKERGTNIVHCKSPIVATGFGIATELQAGIGVSRGVGLFERGGKPGWYHFDRIIGGGSMKVAAVIERVFFVRFPDREDEPEQEYGYTISNHLGHGHFGLSVTYNKHKQLSSFSCFVGMGFALGNTPTLFKGPSSIGYFDPPSARPDTEQRAESQTNR